MPLLGRTRKQVGDYTVTQVSVLSTKHGGEDRVCSVSRNGMHGQENGEHCTDHEIPGKPPVRHRAKNCPLEGSNHCGLKNKFLGR